VELCLYVITDNKKLYESSQPTHGEIDIFASTPASRIPADRVSSHSPKTTESP